jgi:hypothetical protein
MTVPTSIRECQVDNTDGLPHGRLQRRMHHLAAGESWLNQSRQVRHPSVLESAQARCAYGKPVRQPRLVSLRIFDQHEIASG